MQYRNARISYECRENGNELIGLCASSNRSGHPPLFGATLDNAFASLRLTPKSIDVENIGANPSDGQLEKSLLLCCLKENPLFLRESMANVAATYLCARRHATAEPLHIIFIWSSHC